MRYFETRKARIEIIPMIDIMLFLLVFFAMMTLRMIPTTGQVSKLPTSSTASVMPAPKLLIEIRAGGHVFVDGQATDDASLTALVRGRDAAKLAVTIAGGEDASLQQVMHVIDAVRKGGATQIGLAARQSSE
ncbi:biopolymer transporter ExbD [Paucibacter sp. DJ1R-11]|uniref:ExbD/TolR family protein n=1 Tax=Paucibacter sp. DJ1R-11 TaxID=2893556 RepID=UPI0021E3BBDC|nr:biopolymer transporter ExbD [Paucibacter sp. DJ1R-11]MCV2365896.1 biopolymer transporter ExbD [Paucibacter sp. DJ1R-11]